MAGETILIRSGDLYYQESAEGCNTPLLNPGNKIWLNEAIIDMYEKIAALGPGGGGTPGPEGPPGRNVELKLGQWPEFAIDARDAVLWRFQPTTADPDPTWMPLIFKDDLKGDPGEKGDDGEPGPEGPEGAPGQPGAGVMVVGSVQHERQLFTLPHVNKGDGYMVLDTGHIWRCRDDIWDAYLHWDDLGKITGPAGPRGPKGDKGAKGDRGPKGADGGGVSEFVVQWIVNSATSAAISGVMNEVSSMVNDAINDAINQMMSEMENMVTDAVEKAVSDALEDIKGEKGDKGDKGDDGEPGRSFQLKGRFDTVAEFQLAFPPSKDTVGFAAMIGKVDSNSLNLWAVTQSGMDIPGFPPVYKCEDFGKLEGPKGRDATWEVSIRDTAFVETKHITVESDLPAGVAGMYIQDTDSIVVEGLSGSQQDPKQVGFRMRMKYPIPKLIKDGDATGVPTKGKVLGNDGEKLQWVEGGSGGTNPDDEILLKGADGRIWALTVDNTGRLCQDLSIETTDKEMLKIKSPNGRFWGITINNAGKLVVNEVR